MIISEKIIKRCQTRKHNDRKKYPLIVVEVKPTDYNGRVMRGTALSFRKARETKNFYFIEWTPTHEKKYPKIKEENDFGRLSECERGTEKLNVGFSKSYIYDANSEYVKEIKQALLEKKLNDFKGQPIQNQSMMFQVNNRRLTRLYLS